MISTLPTRPAWRCWPTSAGGCPNSRPSSWVPARARRTARPPRAGWRGDRARPAAGPWEPAGAADLRGADTRADAWRSDTLGGLLALAAARGTGFGHSLLRAACYEERPPPRGARL